MKTFMLLCAVVSLAACGGASNGSTQDAGTDVSALSGCFTGDWNMVLASASPESVGDGWGTVSVEADDTVLHVHGLCPDGTGDIALVGAGTGTTGNVNLTCTVVRANASSLTVNITSAALVYIKPGFLVVQLRGTAPTANGSEPETILLQGGRLASSSAGACP